MIYTQGSLFSGQGGFDIASEWMGWENVFHCELNPFGRRILNYYWPNAISYEDITKTDFTIHRGRVDVLTGGFPCQPYSVSGKQKGTEDERHLWPEMRRAIREIAPKYVVGENVPGLVSWNGGLVFEEVQADLEDEGYEVWAYILPACSVGAPHRRDRVWFVANAHDRGDMRHSRKHEGEGEKERLQERHEIQQPEKPIGTRPNMERASTDTKGERSGGIRDKGQKEGARNSDELSGKQHRISGYERNAADPGLLELQGGKLNRGPEKTWPSQGKSGQSSGPVRPNWQEFPTQSPVCYGNDGVSARLDVEALYPHRKSGRKGVKGGGFGKWRSESIKSGGNAIVPELAYRIFEAIQLTEEKLYK